MKIELDVAREESKATTRESEIIATIRFDMLDECAEFLEGKNLKIVDKASETAVKCDRYHVVRSSVTAAVWETTRR